MIAKQDILSHHFSAHSAIKRRASLVSLLVLSLLLSACGGGGTRGAGGAPIEDERARREVAEQQLLGAQALEEQGRLEEAAYAYEHLWRLYPLPRFLILAARTHDRRGARIQQVYHIIARQLVRHEWSREGVLHMPRSGSKEDLGGKWSRIFRRRKTGAGRPPSSCELCRGPKIDLKN